MARKVAKNLSLSPEGERLLTALAKHFGISQSAVVEMLVRERARDESIEDAARRKASEENVS